MIHPTFLSPCGLAPLAAAAVVGVLVFLALALVLRSVLDRKLYFVNKFGIILVTGASCGIGRHAVEYIAKRHEGFIVLCGVRKQADMDSINALNIPNLVPIIVDVANTESCCKCIEYIKALSKEKKVPFVALVNNAGVGRSVPAEYHPIEDVKELFDVSVFGAIHLTQLAIPLLRESKGRIVSLSSIAGVVGAPLRSVYCSSKFALEGYMESLRRELFFSDISISVIEPGMIKTEIFKRAIEAMKAETDSIINSPTKMQYYGRFYNEAFRAKRLEQIKNANEPIVTSEAIEHALFDRYPKTRYVVSSLGKTPGYVLTWLVWVLPDRLKDKLVASIG